MHFDSKPSIWNIRELLTWLDLNFLPNTDNSDVENYCSFIGAYEVFSMFRGIVPIVHGPVGCISSYYSTRIATRLDEKLKPLPFSTCMDNNDVIFGAVEKLEKTIKEVDQLYHPKLIVILTTCVSDMIKEDIDSLTRRLKAEVNADLIYLYSGGISCKGFRDGANDAFRVLMNYIKDKNTSSRRNPKSVNLFLRRVNGKISDNQDLLEIKRMLAVNGIKVNTVVRVGTTYEELLQIPDAEANISLCYTYGKESMGHLKELFNQPYSTKSYPIGLTGTIQWVKEITGILNLDDRFSNSDEVIEMEKEITKLKAFLSAKLKENKMYIWHPGEKGLAFVKLAVDLGMEPFLIGFTYYLLKATRETIINLMKDGYDPKVIIRGHSNIWLDHENKYILNERPLLLMPKKFWLGNLPCVDIDLFRDNAVGLSGLRNIVKEIYACYCKNNPVDNNSIFDRYFETRFEKIEWSNKIENLIGKRP